MVERINKPMTELKPILVQDNLCFYSLSFDIDDFIGDGISWLQLYDSDKKMIYDKPFAGSQWTAREKDVYETVFALLRPWKWATSQF